MTLHHDWASRWVLRQSTAVGGVAVIVATWWLLISGSIALAAPMPAARDQLPDLAVAPGGLAHIHAPPLVAWSIPVNRQEFEAYNLAFAMDEDAALEAAIAATEWIAVTQGQEVRVIQIDGAATQVELLDGADAGRRGWLLTRHLIL